MSDASETRAVIRAKWATLTNFLTIVALLFWPTFFFETHMTLGAPWWWAVTAAFVGVAAVRGGMDLVARKLLPWPTLFDAPEESAKVQDALARKRFNYWKAKYKLAYLILFGITAWWGIQKGLGHDSTWLGTAASAANHVKGALTNGAMLQQLIILPLFFVANMVLFMGPMLAMGISQIKLYEPGDVDFSVKLEDVRGQQEAKDEITKVVSLWESGEDFVLSGGKRERGILFLGPPGVGKTMLAKAIATSFNAPIVTIPGSGFAQTFIGMDVLVVRYLMYKAKKAARKWGGQCIVFIDEIDAVGLRRQSLQGAGGMGGMGGMGMFSGGGGLALNQLLVAMDSLDSPPFLKRTRRSKINTWLDASYFIPRTLGTLPLRLPKAKSTGAEIHWIGATNVQLEALDPALIRAGRMGRHIYFRKPTKGDRLDIFDLYLGKVQHDPALDTPEARDELAGMTEGYSPASIEQVTSMALTTAHHDGRHVFDRQDILNAMTAVESGTAVNITYNEKETKAVAIHEAGHATVAHVYMVDEVNTRLSIRMRGGSLGHNAAQAKDEHFLSFRDAEVAKLLWGLGAMAAELVFFGQNSTGVGGDIQQTTQQAQYMVGAAAMGPDRIAVDLVGDDLEDETSYIERKLQALGYQLLAFAPEPMAVGGPKGVLVAQLLGQAFVTAYNFILTNKDKVETVADELVMQREIFGNELVGLLDARKLSRVEFKDIDLGRTTSWPPNTPNVRYKVGPRA